MKKPLIPFGWMPGHWGLKGNTREIARAEYELSGAELELRLAELRLPPGDELEKARLQILKSHSRITEEEYTQRMIDLSPGDDRQKELARLAHDLETKKITQDQHDRKRADVLGEPWVSMPRIHWNPIGKSRAYFELEYNDHFLQQLRESGYSGEDAAMVNQWMNEVCMGILEETNGPPFVSMTRRGLDSDMDQE
jgi:hypothetical protein